jgi:hypothetical protein
MDVSVGGVSGRISRFAFRSVEGTEEEHKEMMLS